MKGAGYKITLKMQIPADTRSKSMNLSSNFDRALNTMYQTRSEVTGVALAELFDKMLQSNKSIDNDNDLTLHVQRVNLPRDKGNTKRKLAVNMGLNILLKRCVLQLLHNMMMSPVLVTPCP